jgi:hypothetical protein
MRRVTVIAAVVAMLAIFGAGFDLHERAATAKEVGRLAGAFSHARDQLVVVNRVAEGNRRPPRPTPGISRKQ